MKSYAKILEMLDYVDHLPENTEFNYFASSYCLFGLGVKRFGSGTKRLISLWHGVGYQDYLAELFDLTYPEFVCLWGALKAHYEFDTKDRHAAVRAARQMIASWRAREVVKYLKDYDRFSRRFESVN